MALDRRVPQTPQELDGQGADRPHDHHRERCLPTEILAEVLRCKVCTEGRACHGVRVSGRVKRVEHCYPEVIQARVQAGERAWEVTALFRVALKVETEYGERTVRTMLFYRATIPFPAEEKHDGDDGHGDCGCLEARVQASDLCCSTTVSEDCYNIEVELTFQVTVYALEKEVITVCRLEPHGPDPH